MNSNYVSVESFAVGFTIPSQAALATLPSAKCAGPNIWPSKQPECCKQQGNNPMRSNNEIKNYFADRAETVFYSLDKGLQTQFGLKDDSAPRTAADVVARIQAGKYVLPSKDADYGVQSITWRDPSVVKDTAGYEVAYKALKTVRTSTIDQIMADETKALGAVDAFEAWTYTAPVAVTATI